MAKRKYHDFNLRPVVILNRLSESPRPLTPDELEALSEWGQDTAEAVTRFGDALTAMNRAIQKAPVEAFFNTIRKASGDA